VYYDIYRRFGNEDALDFLYKIKRSSVQIIQGIPEELLTQAGRLKATHKISLADSIALAQTYIVNGELVTSDHREMDVIESKENIKFFWIR
jgi:predicted nucleic acid-binding protein